MSTNPKIERLLERYSPERREALRKILLGTTIYVAPLVASYSMQNLGGVANAQSGNVGNVAIPVDSGLGLAAATGAIAVAGAFVLRRRRSKKDQDKS
jgi:MYXO-CTERM domain-containing protein